MEAKYYNGAGTYRTCYWRHDDAHRNPRRDGSGVPGPGIQSGGPPTGSANNVGAVHECLGKSHRTLSRRNDLGAEPTGTVLDLGLESAEIRARGHLIDQPHANAQRHACVSATARRPVKSDRPSSIDIDAVCDPTAGPWVWNPSSVRACTDRAGGDSLGGSQ